tara:strand:- start:242 stop:763 length:522 start_codon:yes stop_codon:yes gene_type:complete
MSKTTIPTGGIADSAVSTAKIADSAVTAAKAGFSAGKLGQMVSVQKVAGAPSTSSTSYVDMTGLTVNITPSASNSKILCMMAVNGLSCSNDNLDAISIKILYGSTDVTLFENAMYQTGTNAENENVTLIGVVDAGGTSEVTVKGQFKNRQSNPISFNSTTNDESDLVVMEILA